MGGSKKHQAHNLLVVSEQKFEVELKKYVNDIQFACLFACLFVHDSILNNIF